jgi:subtilisin-like proprotein convertase family protein
VTSSIVVASVTSPIKKVAVSLHITHTSDDDLDISLVAPDGTTINLSSDNGGTASDYGTDCVVDASRTVFDDSGTLSIIGQPAPFVGSFRPEQPLSTFIGKTGADVNGTWKLIVTDDTGGAVGTLRCWSLFISPTACTDGGGFCDTCPGVVSGTISTNDFTNSIRMFRDGSAFASTCAAAKACPGPISDPNTHYDTHTFTNTGGPACVTVHLDDPCGNLFATAYLGSYNPADLCANYLGDIGNSSAAGSFSFNVPANTNFVVVVNDVGAGGGVGCDYTLVAIGTECPPVLAIDLVPGNKVRLHWPTTASGYLLEATDVLVPASFLPVPDQPIVIGGRYNVTNNVTGTNKFYQLIKP